MCLEGGTYASFWFGEEGGVQSILTLCPHQLPLRGYSSSTSHCPDVPSVHHYTPLPLFSWSRLHFFQFALANTFCQTTKAQRLLSILLGGHSKFLAFSHFAMIPMALHSHPRLWLLCSSNTLLDVAILWEPLSSLGHSERRDMCALCYDIPGDVQISMTVTTIENRVHIMAKDLHIAQVKQWLHETKLSMNPCSVLWYFLFHSLSSLLMPVLTRSINQFYDPRVSLNPQFEKHHPHSGFLLFTSPGGFGSWGGCWAPNQKSGNCSTHIFALSQNAQLSE